MLSISSLVSRISRIRVAFPGFAESRPCDLALSLVVSIGWAALSFTTALGLSHHLSSQAPWGTFLLETQNSLPLMMGSCHPIWNFHLTPEPGRASLWARMVTQTLEPLNVSTSSVFLRAFAFLNLSFRSRLMRKTVWVAGVPRGDRALSHGSCRTWGHAGGAPQWPAVGWRLCWAFNGHQPKPCSRLRVATT